MTAKSKYYKMTEGDDLTLQLTEFPPNASAIGTDIDGNPKDNSSMIATYPIGQELYPISASDATSILPDGGSDGSSGTWGFAFTTNGTIEISKIRTILYQIASNYKLQLGVYEYFPANQGGQQYKCIASTAKFTTHQGFNENGLVESDGVTPTTVTLYGGVLYYMCAWSENGAGNNQFFALQNRLTSTTVPLFTLQDPINRLTIGDTMASGNNSSNVNGIRPWMQVCQ